MKDRFPDDRIRIDLQGPRAGADEKIHRSSISGMEAEPPKKKFYDCCIRVAVPQLPYLSAG
jgi:hypothetical protein